MKERLNLSIDSELKKKLKIQAAKEGRDVSAIIEQLVKEYLEKKETTG